ncbi:hypothetical protein PR048_012053 [Dryococelus australis]|uniref:RNA-directed DNA polymerase n=1 Tax=Dryococelus australis TaxID=614101 RepID=A0ABQ9HNM7_9NEOP|nr:hypothetical protein PR048_012053 [Dryococelus australis]
MRGRGKREIPENTRRSAVSSSTIPTCENPGVTRPGIELGVLFSHPNQPMATPAKLKLRVLLVLFQKNGTSKDRLTVFTGADDITKYGIIHTFNGNTQLPHWKTERCNRIDGSDGSIFPPHITKDTTLYVYEKDLCRKLPLRMERCWNARKGEAGVPRENRPASGIVLHENLGMNPPGIEPRSPWWEASTLATVPPLPQHTCEKLLHSSKTKQSFGNWRLAGFRKKWILQEESKDIDFPHQQMFSQKWRKILIMSVFVRLDHLVLLMASSMSACVNMVAIQIYADVSKEGLGVCMMQNGHPVDITSRSLNEYEVRNGKAEKEFLAIQFATVKFHGFLTDITMSRFSQITNKKKTTIQKETDEYNQLKLVKHYCKQGWLEAKKKIDQVLGIYWKNKEALSEWEGIVLFENKIVFPREMRLGLLKQAHEGHMGIENAKLRARQLYYWPGLSTEVKEFVKRCSLCSQYNRQNSKEPLHPWPIASRPWERVSADIVTYGGVSYLVVIDTFSNRVETIGIEDKSATSVIMALKFIFVIHDGPYVLGADNVPYDSHLFKQFAEQWNFEVKLSSPNYPQSNGVAQLLMSRICKTKLPNHWDIVQPYGPDPKEIVRNGEGQQGLDRSYYDRASEEFSVLQPEQNVITRDPKDRRGQKVRRNRKHLKESEATARSPDEGEVSKYEVEQVTGEQADPLLCTKWHNAQICSKKLELSVEVTRGSRSATRAGEDWGRLEIQKTSISRVGKREYTAVNNSENIMHTGRRTVAQSVGAPPVWGAGGSGFESQLMGIALSARARIQINLAVSQVVDIKQVATFPDIVFPILWFEDGIDGLPVEVTDLLNLATKAPPVARAAIAYGLFALGGVLLIMAISCLVRSSGRQETLNLEGTNHYVKPEKKMNGITREPKRMDIVNPAFVGDQKVV